MARLALVIGNKNYSSWSMRPWVLLREAQIAFEEIQLWFDQDARAEGIERYSPTRLVPVLMVDDAPVWDSLAICETIAEMFPDQELWPSDTRARQVARSICAEMHAGFRDLRGAMPVNIRASHPGKGMNPAVRKDIDRVIAIWESCRERIGRDGTPASREQGYRLGDATGRESGAALSSAGVASVSEVTSPKGAPVPPSDGALLFGRFGIADAFYAPVVMRFTTYVVELPPVAQAYADAVRALPAVQEWMAAARRETGFVAADEPYAVT